MSYYDVGYCELMEEKQKYYLLKALVAILGLLIVGLLAYVLILPFYPEIEYNFWPGQKSASSDQAAVPQAAEPAKNTVAKLPVADLAERANSLIIPKIGVDIPIVDSSDSAWALNRGAWRMPETSTPEKGSNTAIAGHRFKYLPPNNLTFYLLDKLVAGDVLVVIWSGKEYQYQVVETKIVLPTEVSVLAPTEKSIITLITCDPIFSQRNRLIVTAGLIEPQ